SPPTPNSEKPKIFNFPEQSRLGKHCYTKNHQSYSVKMNHTGQSYCASSYTITGPWVLSICDTVYGDCSRSDSGEDAAIMVKA
ncbi:hypothetical protein, partial [Bifidobacterium minimum]